MTKKILLVLLLVTLLAGGAFAKENRHKSGDMLLGIDIGAGVTLKGLKSITDETMPKGYYGIAFDAGLNFDFYLLPWFSLNGGVFVRPGLYVLLNTNADFGKDFFDVAKTPICLTFPLMAHFNIPKADFLYLGAGVNLNIPVASISISDGSFAGKFYLGIPIDFGFDYIKAGKGGGRFFFRVTPEFHFDRDDRDGKPVVFSFMWQIYNFKIR